MKREADLIDVWFDSGSMLMHNGIILLKTKIKLTKIKIFQLISLQKVDQTRWFYTLHAIGTLVLIK
jgi:isoleucyl-tRNA synthetase